MCSYEKTKHSKIIKVSKYVNDKYYPSLPIAFTGTVDGMQHVFKSPQTLKLLLIPNENKKQ